MTSLIPVLTEENLPDSGCSFIINFTREGTLNLLQSGSIDLFMTHITGLQLKLQNSLIIFSMKVVERFHFNSAFGCPILSENPAERIIAGQVSAVVFFSFIMILLFFFWLFA